MDTLFISHRHTGKKEEERSMSHSAKKSRHRSPCTARSMTRLALGPLILTGLFLVGSVCADPVRAEEIDLASQPGFNTMRRD